MAAARRVIFGICDRGITRKSNNPTGDLAEYLFCKAFGWHQEANCKMLLEGVNGQLALRADVRSENDHQRKLKHPKVVFGLLPDSTSHGDILVKLL